MTESRGASMLPLENGPSARTFDIEELVQRVWRGEIRIPTFQRQFKWSWEDGRRLFDSIVKGYPVGNLLLWSRPARAQRVRIGAVEVEAPDLQSAYFVVDGQQRLTSLASMLHPAGLMEPRFAMGFNLKTSEFVRYGKVIEASVIPLPTLFDLQSLLRWFASNVESAEYLDYASDITRRLRQYEIPSYLVSADSPDVLQDIFDRMNNYGKRLTRAEVFSALYATENSDLNAHPTFDSISADIDEDYSFGLLEADTVLASVLARRGPDVRREIRSEFDNPSDEGRDQAYIKGGIALKKAVAFLQTEAGVPHVTFLAYQYLLVALTRFFAVDDEVSPRDRQLLRRWYWQAALAGPEAFKGGTPNVARILCGRIVMDDASRSVSQLLDALPDRPSRDLDIRRFAAPTAETKVILCALWAQGPRNPVTSDRFTQADLANAIGEQKTASGAVGYLVARGQLSRSHRPSAANRILSLGESPAESSVGDSFSSAPVCWSASVWSDFLQSHLLDEEAAATLESGHLDRVIELRHERLGSVLTGYLAKQTEAGYDNSPRLASLVIDDFDQDGS